VCVCVCVQNGLLSSVPYLAQWIMSIICSVWADRLINTRTMSVTAVRKVYAIIGEWGRCEGVESCHLPVAFTRRVFAFSGTIGPGLGVMGASFVGCNKIVATVCFAVGMALMGFCYPSIRVNSLDLSPNYAPTIMALVNGIGCLSGMATPYVAGILTPNVSAVPFRFSPFPRRNDIIFVFVYNNPACRPRVCTSFYRLRVV